MFHRPLGWNFRKKTKENITNEGTPQIVLCFDQAIASFKYQSRQTYLVHDLVPVLAGEDLEDCEHCDGEGVEVGGRDAVRETEGASKELGGHAIENILA